MDNIIHDQWIVTELGGTRIYIFDPDAVCPQDSVGNKVDLKVGIMPIRIRSHPCDRVGFLDKRNFVGMVINSSKTEDRFDYLININGLTAHLTWSQFYLNGTCLKIYGRIDVTDIKNETYTGWKTVE